MTNTAFTPRTWPLIPQVAFAGQADPDPTGAGEDEIDAENIPE